MTLKEWNWVQCYIYKEFEIDPKDLKKIISIATIISDFKTDEFSVSLLEDMIKVVTKFIEIRGS